MKTTESKPVHLTKKTVEALPLPEAGSALYWDDDLAGFGVRVTANGVRSYVAQSRVNGMTRRVTIERHGVLTAEQARKKARSELGAMSDGIDPSAAKKKSKALSVTLRECVEHYLRVRRTKDGFPLKPRTIADARYHLEHAFKRWADVPIATLNSYMVGKRHEELTATGPKQADQAFRNLRAWMNFAIITYTLPDGSPILTNNPVATLKRRWNGSGARTSRVPLDQLGAWWAELQRRRADPELTDAGKTGADIIAFLTLTGLRWSEAATLTRDAVNLKEGTLRLPDPKNRQPVLLPLSDAAVAILKARRAVADPENPEGPSYFFPGRGNHGCINDARPTLRAVREALAAKAKEEKREAEPVEVSPHDLRRTFIACGDALRIERWRLKMLTNHSIKSSPDVTLSNYTEKVTGAGEKDRREFGQEANTIAGFIEDQRKSAEAANVVALPRKGRRA